MDSTAACLPKYKATDVKRKGLFGAPYFLRNSERFYSPIAEKKDFDPGELWEMWEMWELQEL